MPSEQVERTDVMPRFGRVLTAMITPFTPEGALDIDGAQTLARWLVDNGNDGLGFVDMYKQPHSPVQRAFPTRRQPVCSQERGAGDR